MSAISSMTITVGIAVVRTSCAWRGASSTRVHAVSYLGWRIVLEEVVADLVALGLLTAPLRPFDAISFTDAALASTATSAGVNARS